MSREQIAAALDDVYMMGTATALRSGVHDVRVRSRCIEEARANHLYPHVDNLIEAAVAYVA